MTWVTFSDRASFDAYHLAACNVRSIPRPGYRQSNNSPQLMGQWTNAWSDLFGVFTANAQQFLLANVPAADVATFGLTVVPNDPVIPFPTGTRTILFLGSNRTIFSVAPDWQQPKPATWTDPNTGTTYDTTTGLPV